MDGFFGIGILELFVIAVLALIVLGPERLPGVMREGAKYIRMLRKMTNEFTSQFSDELQALDELNPRKIFNEMTDPNRPDPDEKPKSAPAKPGAPLPKAAATNPSVGKNPAPPAAAAASMAGKSVAATPATQPTASPKAAPANGRETPPTVSKEAATSPGASVAENSILSPEPQKELQKEAGALSLVNADAEPSPMSGGAISADESQPLPGTAAAPTVEATEG